MTRAERRREERKNTKLAKWLLKLNSDQRQLLTKYCIEATKSDIIALQEAYIRVLRPLLHEGTDGDIETAEKKNIPYQIEVMIGLTSTNADRFSICRGGVKACTVSIPLRYMHTPSEVISIKDVEYTGKLLAEFVKGVK